MTEMGMEMLNTMIVMFDMLGLKKVIIWVAAYYNMLPITTVLTIIGIFIALIWICKEFSKTKASFDPQSVNQMINEQKGIIRQDQAENVV